jgi:hypothetical protein
MWQEMLCADWLKRLIDLDIWDEKPFIIDDVRKVGEKYILRDHELTVYNTEKGQLSEEHCVALNIETEGLCTIVHTQFARHWIDQNQLVTIGHSGL